LLPLVIGGIRKQLSGHNTLRIGFAHTSEVYDAPLKLPGTFSSIGPNENEGPG
jgi:hypothetical protein